MVQSSLSLTAGALAAPSTGRLSRAQVARVAAAGCPVLVTGETGVGKGYIARWMHQQSPRCDRPFVTVNCGALPPDIIDSHLFGHRRGAFSDAHQDHPGLVRQADGGTLLLDEIADLPPAGQMRMLRLIEDGEIQPVGSPRPQRVDVRVIAATRLDLESLVSEGQFRKDLFYRLNVIELHVPPLRHRLDQLPDLVRLLTPRSPGRSGGRRSSWTTRRCACSAGRTGRATSASCAAFWSDCT